MDAKPFYLSKTVWGAVVLLGAVILSMFGVEVTEQEQAGLVDTLVGAADAIAAAAGFVLVLIGRIKAVKPLRLALPLALALFLAGCSGIPAGLVEDHLDAVEPSHTYFLEQHGTDAEQQTFAEHYRSMREAVDAARGE